MGILRSVALGKSRKSAGELTFYQRIGVACFRQKPAKSPGYKSSVPQRMQQSVFRFIKANMDAAGLKSFVDLYYDAKPRKGKSETKMNMFYRSFLPHLVAEKPQIYALSIEDLINPALFLGVAGSSADKLTNGQLGDLILLSGSADNMTMSATALDQIIDKANTMISSKETPFGISNLFVGLVGADPTSNTGYKVVEAANITPTLAGDTYTFDLSAITEGVDLASNVYVALLVAGKDSQGAIDITRRKFATDTAVLNGSGMPVPQIDAISNSAVVDGNQVNVVVSTAALTAAGISKDDFSSAILNGSVTGGKDLGVNMATESGGNTTIYSLSMEGFKIAIVGSEKTGSVTYSKGEVVLCVVNGLPNVTWTTV